MEDKLQKSIWTCPCFFSVTIADTCEGVKPIVAVLRFPSRRAVITSPG